MLFRKFIMIVFIATLFSSCKNEEPKIEEVNTSSGSILQEYYTPTEPFDFEHFDIIPDSEIPVSEYKEYNKEKTHLFPFSEDEILAYNEFQKKYDKKVFANLQPYSVAKIWLEYVMSDLWESEFMMYSKSSLKNAEFRDRALAYSEYLYVLQTFREGIKYGLPYKNQYELVEFLYSNFKDGKFIEESDNKGYISFIGDYEEKYNLVMEKNSDGIWEIDFPGIMAVE